MKTTWILKINDNDIFPECIATPCNIHECVFYSPLGSNILKEERFVTLSILFSLLSFCQQKQCGQQVPLYNKVLHKELVVSYKMTYKLTVYICYWCTGTQVVLAN